MKRIMGFVAGAVTGALVGATFAVLFAPMPGKTLREDLENRIQNVKDQMQKAATARQVELETRLEELRKPQ